MCISTNNGQGTISNHAIPYPARPLSDMSNRAFRTGDCYSLLFCALLLRLGATMAELPQPHWDPLVLLPFPLFPVPAFSKCCRFGRATTVLLVSLVSSSTSCWDHFGSDSGGGGVLNCCGGVGGGRGVDSEVLNMPPPAQCDTLVFSGGWDTSGTI